MQPKARNIDLLTVNVCETVRARRLVLCKPALADSAALAKVKSESFAELVPWFHHEMGTREQEADPHWQATKILSYQNGFAARERLPYFIWEGEELIGLIELIPNWRRGHFRLIYWLSSSKTKRGYGTEAVTAITRFAFEALDARLVTTGHAEPNISSQKLAIRLGFNVYSRHPFACELQDGSLVTGVAYEMQNPEKLPELQVSWD